ncbi:MAG TPA: helix-hairpin-helix domain-containing protein [Candidatus Acidoferrum sp.]|nr:helix-hairpin-helix domain-containing protein [Candidatus Acidoferrum sp.]
MKRWSGRAVLAIATALLVIGMAGCEGDSAERDKQIHDEAAKAAAQAKPAVEQAAKAVKAAVDGAKEGWENTDTNKLDLNSADQDDLTGLPGIGKHEAKRIMAGRPYKDKHELVSKRIVSASEYEKIKNDITVK